MEFMSRQMDVKKILDGILEAPPAAKELPELGLSSDFLIAAKERPDVAGLVVFERRLCTVVKSYLNEVLQAQSKELQREKAVERLLQRFKVFEQVSMVLQRTLGYHAEVIRRAHENCPDAAACTCFRAPLGFSQTRSRSISMQLLDCWRATIHKPYALNLLQSYLEPAMEEQWRGDDTVAGPHLAPIVDMCKSLDEFTAVQRAIDTTVTRFVLGLSSVHPSTAPDSVGVWARKLLDIRTKMSHWLRVPLLVRQVLTVIATKLIAPNRANLLLPLSDWLMSGVTTRLADLASLFLVDQQVHGETCNWLEVGLKDAIYQEMVSALDGLRTAAEGKTMVKPGAANGGTSGLNDAQQQLLRLDPVEWFRTLRDWKQKYLGLVSDPAIFKTAVQQMLRAFKAAADLILSPSQQILSLAIHAQLSTGSDQLDELLDFLDWAIPLVKEQDVLFFNTTSHMETRLLHPSCILDNEKQLATRLRVLGTVQEVRMMLIMIEDMTASADLSERFASSKIFQQSQHNGQHLTPKNFQLVVVSPNAWKTITPFPKLRFPAPMQRTLFYAEKFYVENHPHRLLSWSHRSGYLVIKLLYTKQGIEIICPTQTGLLLLVFDTLMAKSLPKSRILETVIESEDAKGTGTKVLKALVDGKLLSEEKSASGDEVAVNTAYSHKQKKVSLMPKVAVQGASATASAQSDSVMRARDCVLQAAIVRLMKSNQRMEHGQMYLSAVNQTKARFFPTMPQFKRAVEALIEKEYIQRTDEDRSVYRYLA